MYCSPDPTTNSELVEQSKQVFLVLFVYSIFLFERFISLFSHWHYVSSFWNYSKWQGKISSKSHVKDVCLLFVNYLLLFFSSEKSDLIGYEIRKYLVSKLVVGSGEQDKFVICMSDLMSWRGILFHFLDFFPIDRWRLPNISVFFLIKNHFSIQINSDSS